MAQDLKLAKDIIKPDDPKIGQFWRDMVNGDVLKIQEVSEYNTPDVSSGVSAWKSISMGRGGELIREPWAEGEKPIGSELEPAQPITYVVCACYPRGEYYMGIQEMKASHFETERFKRVGWFKSLWYRWKFRRSQPLA